MEKIKGIFEKFPEQIRRLLIVIGAIIAGVVTVRYLVLPSSLTDTRFHRQSTIEREAAKNTKEVFPEEINSRQKKKKQVIDEYVEKDAPWHKKVISYLKDDFANFAAKA